ncbi:MAG: C-terminal domain found in long catalase, partial [Mycobacteriales bacterium]
YKHLKAIAAAGDGRSLLTTAVGDVADQPGIVTGASGAAVAAAFLAAIARHRHWDRQRTEPVSA